MIVALMMGREGSVGFPGKNIFPVLGRALMEYPLIAAKNSGCVDRIYISTDSQKIAEIGRLYGSRIIDRPAELCDSKALGEDVFAHGFNHIKKELKEEESIDLIVLLMCNAPTVTSDIIVQGIKALQDNPEYDSAVSVSKYNMWSPLRARKITENGLLTSFVPMQTFGDVRTLNCDRDSQGDVWFADMGVSIVRPRCLNHLENGMLPQKWMGQKIYPLKQLGGCDVDYEWQIPGVEYWLKEHGY